MKQSRFSDSQITREQVRQVLFEYIEVFYNRIRRHAKIGNQAPTDFASQQQFAA